MSKIDLSGRWDFCLDGEKIGITQAYYTKKLEDQIVLPTTLSQAKKGKASDTIHTGFLTDPYQFEGYTWYSKEIEDTFEDANEVYLILERTRTSQVWVDDSYVGMNQSLCTSHRYRLTPYLKETKQQHNLDLDKKPHRLTVLIDNTSCPVKGGHMTSLDTQTNWNGITGEIYLEVLPLSHITKTKIYPDASKKRIMVRTTLCGVTETEAKITITDSEDQVIAEVEQQLTVGENSFCISLDQKAQLWSEHTPILYSLNMTVASHSYRYPFGLRDFKAKGNYFEINGNRTFLRGKHDGLIFPLTGYAPTDLKSWLEVMTTAKSYGINHYRFHTCCPPEAAFVAADILGIYMEPELPFWGTVTEEGEAGHDEKGQQYLIEEGYRILDEFGNHPSFVMMSLGNELWGSKKRLSEILRTYKQYDGRPLYTQGSNNFQFVPCVLEEEDFFCGVRFRKDRLFRGSYAMCDAPQGHLQTMAPNSLHNYNEMIRPSSTGSKSTEDSELLIQYETGVKKVKAEASEDLIPELPVVSHEIGQYAMYPDYSELTLYTGVLQPRNLIEFRRRLDQEGMLPYAKDFFQASGRFAADCYKAELETALRSSELAGFQLLDLQDFSGQGTALVGILNAFMKNKGVIAEEEWREFCSDTVLLAELPRFVYVEGEKISFGITLVTFAWKPISSPKIRVTIMEETIQGKTEGKDMLYSGVYTSSNDYSNGVYHLKELELTLPEANMPRKLSLYLELCGSEVKNHYDLWLYPNIRDIDTDILRNLSFQSMDMLGINGKVEKKEDEEQEENEESDKNKEINNKEEIDKKIESDKKEASDLDNHIVVTKDLTEAVEGLNKGHKVLLFPTQLEDNNSIQGTYCTDFWCYPMFRSISESMKKPAPIGTHGLLINEQHPIFQTFPTTYHTTPQWYDIVTNSRSMILDGTNIEPIVWTIDNFERNHRLGLLFELRVGDGKLVVCTADLLRSSDHLLATWLLKSILRYVTSEEFNPQITIRIDELLKLF